MKHKAHRSVIIIIFVIIVFLTKCDSGSGVVSDACELKYKNNVDEKPDIFLTTSKNYLGICRIRHERTSSLDYYVGPKYPYDEDPEINIYAIQFDSKEDKIFYLSRTQTSLVKLYETRLNDSSRQLLFDQEDFRNLGWPATSYLITNTAFDWITKNLYINLHKFIGVINAEYSWDVRNIIGGRNYVLDLSIHPNKGYLYFIDEASYEYDEKPHRTWSIYRVKSDGSNVIQLTAATEELISTMAIDYYTDKLYWTTIQQEFQVIHYSDLDGQTVKSIDSVLVYYDALRSYSRMFAFDRTYLYYRSADSNSIRRINKTSHELDEEYELSNKHNGQIKEVMVFTYASQKIRPDHPCKNENGNCEKYCFALPEKDTLKRSCGCSIFEKVAKNGKSCT